MCGIIGYVGPRECKHLLLYGLERLEYRGYDSAGIALLEEDGLAVHARRRQPPEPEARRRRQHLARDDRARPHALGDPRRRHRARTRTRSRSRTRRSSRSSSTASSRTTASCASASREAGHVFTSETDAETVSHLIQEHYDGDLVEATRLAFNELEGHFAFVAIHRDHPGLLVGARMQCPLVVGIGRGETFLASNAAAFLRETREVHFPEDGDLVAITPDGARFLRAEDGSAVERELIELDWDDESAEKAGFETFMLKEIYEQPDAVAETIGDRVRHGRLELEGFLGDDALKVLRRIVILSAGTSYHAAVAARYAIEEWARVPVEHDIASEWIYRNPVLDASTLVIGISQSGETRDTIAGMKLAREMGARTVAITNMMGSQITREVDSVLYTRAGLEVSVAASKTFTAQVSLLFLVALKLAQVRETLPPGRARPSSSTRSTCCRRRSRRSSTATTRSTRSRSATSTSRSSSTSAATSACRWRSRAR